MKFRKIIREIVQEQMITKPNNNQYTGYYRKMPTGAWKIFYDASKKQKGDIDVESVYPGRSVGGSPDNLNDGELSRAMQNAKTSQFFIQNAFNPNAKKETPKPVNYFQRREPQKAFDNNGFNYQPPLDWQQNEYTYRIFNEPKGKPDAYMQGKYKLSLPPQTNKYFWDKFLETKQENLDANGNTFYKIINGGWVVKNMENVDKWRDVPSGFHPSEYDAALKASQPHRDNSGEHIIQTDIKHTGYYHADHPLGITTKDFELKNAMVNAVKSQKASAQGRRNDNYQKLRSQGFVNDTMNPNYESNQARLENAHFEDQIQQIENAFGAYKSKQKPDEGFDWFGFLLTVASFIPISAPFTIGVTTVLGLKNAIESYNKGNYATAGLDLLLAMVPGVSKLAGEKNLLNLVKVGEQSVELKTVLETHADKWFDTLKTNLLNTLENSTAKKAVGTGVEATSKYAKKQLGDLSAKNIGKQTADYVDNRNNQQQNSGLN